jgi:hypothetical protein
MILVFPGMTGICLVDFCFAHFEKIQVFSDILREIFSKLDHIRPRNEFFKTFCFALKYLTSTVFVVVVSTG